MVEILATPVRKSEGTIENGDRVFGERVEISAFEIEQLMNLHALVLCQYCRTHHHETAYGAR